MKRKAVIWVVITVAVVAFIFWQSTRDARLSSEESRTVLAAVQHILSVIGLGGGLTDHVIRKCAHVFEYAVQAFALGRMFMACRLARKTYVGYALWLGLLTAAIDENIQLFSPGRGSMVQDVLLDFVGTVLGLLLSFL